MQARRKFASARTARGKARREPQWKIRLHEVLAEAPLFRAFRLRNNGQSTISQVQKRAVLSHSRFSALKGKTRDIFAVAFQREHTNGEL